MSEPLLTRLERQRFVRYCREEAESYRLLLSQVEKLGPVVAETLGKSHKQLVMAYALVAAHMDSVEEEAINESDVSDE